MTALHLFPVSRPTGGRCYPARSWIGLVILVMSLFLSCAAARAMTVEEELAVDRVLGVLARPWRINYIRLVTRDYLRHQARVRTGLPAYDQQVEHADRMPAGLYDRLHYRKVIPAVSEQVIRRPDTRSAAKPVVRPSSEGGSSPVSPSPPSPPPPSSPPTEVGITLPHVPTTASSASPPTATAVNPGSQSAWEPRPKPVYFADPTP